MIWGAHPYFWKHPDSMMIFGPLRWNHRQLDESWGVESKQKLRNASQRFPVFLCSLEHFKQLQTAKCCVLLQWRKGCVFGGVGRNATWLSLVLFVTSTPCQAAVASAPQAQLLGGLGWKQGLRDFWQKKDQSDLLLCVMCCLPGKNCKIINQKCNTDIFLTGHFFERPVVL